MKNPSLHSRPFSIQDLDLITEWFNSDEAFGEYDSPGDGTSRDELEMRIKHGTLFGCEIWSAEQTDFAWTSIYFDQRAPWIATITIIIARPEFRNRGFGTEIQRRMIAELKLRNDVEKIEVWTDTENLAESRILEKLGFTLEGVFRRKWKIRGRFRDMKSYGLLRESFE